MKGIVMNDEDFKKLPRNRQRVEIAKDVLGLLATDMIKAAHGAWVDSDLIELGYCEPETELKDILPKAMSRNDCRCCALGACFVAIINRLDNCPRPYNGKLPFSILLPHLRKIFDDEQIVLIENAYELGYGSLNPKGAFFEMYWKKAAKPKPGMDEDLPSPGSDELERAINFGNQYSGNGRLAAIMKNIIENDGTFVPVV
jgi:hypothetical protein